MDRPRVVHYTPRGVYALGRMKRRGGDVACHWGLGMLDGGDVMERSREDVLGEHALGRSFPSPPTIVAPPP